MSKKSPVRKTAPLIKFGQNVRELRNAKGLSQEKLALIIGIHRTYMSEVERGEQNISLTNIVKLAGVFGVEPGELLKEIPTEKPKPRIIRIEV
jgi:transcriptional regulator with XRE-family HTH domain